ncbi:DUF560 domain-containing protein [Oleomonas cavernae]|uniref:DUF560 domain-containing protein n=1 Tax=Oleomonas cavernae TaxID=2320859 RepID=A0A418WI16_9PROT|nr:surface lipoprotein assembly modifier [Oleomonas cavernae]RJF89671.1 DUF560 domain-containing protein [Oleomonas cavernae]
MRARSIFALVLAGAALGAGVPARADDSTLSVPEARQIEARFSEALRAIDAGQYRAAIDLLDGILADHPDLVRVRLELARALFLTGEDDLRATFQFERVLAGDLPETVRVNVERFIAAIRQRRVWSLNAAVAIVPDSNINSGPTSREVIIEGLPPLELKESVTEKSAVGVQASLGGTYRFTLSDKIRLQVGGSVFEKAFEDSRFDDTIVQWSAGPRYLFDRGDVGASLVGYYRWYGNDPYTLALGGRLDGNYLLTDRLRLDAAAQLRRLDYVTANENDGTAFDTDATLRFAVTPAVLTFATVLFTATDAELKTQSYESRGVTLGTYVDLPAGISVGLSARYAQTDYHGVNPLFREKRRDEDWQESLLLLHREFKLLGATPTFRYTRIDHTSSIDVYEYPRDLFEIGLTRQF